MFNPIKLTAMKLHLSLVAISVAALTSCSTAYKTGQTPDDVYFSPIPQREEYVKSEREDDRRNRYDEEYYDDRYLRMKVRNHYRWNDLNDWYSYERWGFGHNYYWGSYYNPYNTWNYYYNPYCCCQGNTYYSNPKTTSYQPQVKPRVFNLGGYTNTGYNNSNNSSNNKTVRTVSTRPVYNNTNTNSGSGRSKESGFSNTIRTIFEGNNNNNNSGPSGSSGSSRTYSPSNSSSSSSSSSSSGSSSGGSSGGGVSRPTRN